MFLITFAHQITVDDCLNILVSSVEGAQRTEIEDDYSFSTELGSAAAEAARSRHTFGKDTGYESTEK